MKYTSNSLAALIAFTLLASLPAAHAGERSGTLTGPSGNTVQRKVQVNPETGTRAAVTTGPAGNSVVVKDQVVSTGTGRVVNRSVTGPAGNTVGREAVIERSPGQRTATRETTGPAGNTLRVKRQATIE